MEGLILHLVHLLFESRSCTFSNKRSMAKLAWLASLATLVHLLKPLAILSFLHCKYAPGSHDLLTSLVQFSHSCTAGMVLETLIFDTSCAILSLLHCEYGPANHDLLTPLVQFSHSCVASMVLEAVMCQHLSCHSLSFAL